MTTSAPVEKVSQDEMLKQFKDRYAIDQREPRFSAKSKRMKLLP